MTVPGGSKQWLPCELTGNISLKGGIFQLEFAWPGTVPRAGQFFLIRPIRFGVFLGRPISAAGWGPFEGEKTMNGGVVTNRGGVSPGSGAVRFLIARRNRGTEELAAMRPGETAELTGPLGNAWGDFFPAIPGGEKKKTALIGGGIGIAPLLALSAELPRFSFDFYAGFKTRLGGGEEEHGLLGPALLNAKETIIAAEDGDEGRKGRIPDFLDPSLYQAVYACGPEPMLKAVTASCGLAGTPCFISMEKHMACGVGACLGCTVRTINGNRRCCAGGPIFRAGEIFFDE